MKSGWVEHKGRKIKTLTVDTAVIGTGCAGYNAADRLFHYGHEDLIILTEGVNIGTSRNTGSDKQTYYKLSLASESGDSVYDMAASYFAGKCMDGDHALVEASLSAGCFYHLCDLGVPFPQNRYGEFVGYKTDHDTSCRATSIGPLTSRAMTEALQASVERKGIRVMDGLQAVSILCDHEGVTGVLCLDKTKLADSDERFQIVHCANVVMATGGPAGIYYDSCYPFGHFGSSGMAYRAGAMGKNLTEWQFGLASIRPRWNVSGSYMQVLPRFVSTRQDGSDEREFLLDYIEHPEDILNLVFYKGYQWPFDVQKTIQGSSIIDLIVYNEAKIHGRRIFLDYRRNPLEERFTFDLLDDEAYQYLKNTGSLFGTPIQRLEHMNAPAVEFYKSRGVNLETEMLEISLCAQHNNGGIDVDCWWQSNVHGLFVVGEAAGTHGVYRPGGSALNAGQVGSERAALYISRLGRHVEDLDQKWLSSTSDELDYILQFDQVLAKEIEGGKILNCIRTAQREMSEFGGVVRNRDRIRVMLEHVKERIANLAEIKRTANELPQFFRYMDLLYTQLVYLSAMCDYIEKGGLSRGSAVYTDMRGRLPNAALSSVCSFLLDDGRFDDQVQNVRLEGMKVEISWREVRPIPVSDNVFENVWREYRLNGNVY